MSLDEPTTGTAQDQEQELVRFWDEARRQGRLDGLPAYFGPTVLASVVPPCFAFAEDPVEADRVLAQVLDGRRTATSAPRSAYAADDAALPARGDLAIVLDGQARPRALLATTQVRVVALTEVDAEHALAEGLDSLERWRAEQDASEQVVLERFEVLHPALRSRATFGAMFGRQP